MCGIAGIVAFDGSAEIDRARLARMGAVLRHRGPDGDGLWRAPGVGFAHRRLAVVDLAGGAQPMTNAAGNVCVTYNGEIYNHREIRAALEPQGYGYRTRSDTETLLHSYEAYGTEMVDRLQGMFAFAIWDAAQRQLLLARDRLGIKPMYYAVVDGELLFGSEIKALVAAGLRADCAEGVLPELLASGYVAGERTLYSGCRRLPPGHVLTWSARSGLSMRRYWRPQVRVPSERRSFRAEARAVRTELEDAVERHLMSDVPLGVLLSGGLDSTALAAIARGKMREPLHTFAVGFDDPDADELGNARTAARALGTRHHEVLVTPRAFFDALPRVIWHEDEPPAFPSSVPLLSVSSLAREHVTVVLTGEGADELFLGYNRYRVALWNRRLGRLYHAAAPRIARRTIRRLAGALPGRWRGYAERSFLALEPDRRTLVFDNFAVFPDEYRRAVLVNPEPAGADPYPMSLLDEAGPEGDLRDQMFTADLQGYLHELLMKQDQMSMAASIESRVPFLDDALVARALAIPAHYRLRGWQTKAVLRAAVRSLVPPDVLARRKLGFPVPLGRWLRGQYWPVVEELVLGPRARQRALFHADTVRRLALAHRAGANHTARLWLLLTLELWWRIVIEGDDPDTVMRPVWRRMDSPRAAVVDQNGRAVAGGHGRTPAQLSDADRVVATARRRRPDDARSA